MVKEKLFLNKLFISPSFFIFLFLGFSSLALAQTQPTQHIPSLTTFTELPASTLYPGGTPPLQPSHPLTQLTAPIFAKNRILDIVDIKPLYFREMILPGTCSEPFEIKVGGAFLTGKTTQRLPPTIEKTVIHQQQLNAALAMTTALKASMWEVSGPLSMTSSPSVAARNFLLMHCPSSCQSSVKTKTLLYRGFRQDTADLQAYGMHQASIYFEHIYGYCS